MNNSERNFKIIKHIGVLSEKTSGWRTELNIVKWNKYGAKYDLRPWGNNHEKVGKGITLTEEELIILKELLEDVNL